ncbi:MAG: selenide, water dikinase SelD [Bryobacterales bacterium]|nr:selenide, water dikinase SelD [Bryobacterales bacterium]
MSPKVLDQVLRQLPRYADPNVLVGFDTSDDAGVYRLSPECALVQTVDFFTPIVDDPFTFGAIAASNSLSDVYAMGGRPITALSVVCYPNKGDMDVLAAILQGGASKMHEAGCPVVGGHSVSDDEVKFGYSVTGLVHPDRVWSNAGARVGDVLLFSKAIGTGVIATALKRGIATEEHVQGAISSMLTLNKATAESLAGAIVHGCTDITGFGLIGHARELALGSNVTVEIEASRVPLLAGALEYAQNGATPGGLKNNRDFASCDVEMPPDISPALEALLYDPQTSGGLLIALPEPEAARVPGLPRIGRVAPRQKKAVRIL